MTNGKIDATPICSRDGRWVLYEDGSSGGRLMRISIDGEKPQRVSEELAANGFDLSPDSKAIAFAAFGHLGEHI